LDSILIHTNLNNRAKEFFERAPVKLDPSIYKGEARSYRGDGQKYESGNQVLDHVARKSPSLKEHIGYERNEIEKGLPRSQRGYSFERDTASSGSFEDVAKQYLMGEGKELYAHLQSKGRDFYNITRIGTADLEGAVAGLAVQGDEAALYGDKNFGAKVSQLAGMYGLTNGQAVRYVLAHEFVHASQKGKYFDDKIMAELDVEHTLKDYFTARGDRDLAAVASDRAANVTSNYGSLGTRAAGKGAYSTAGSN